MSDLKQIEAHIGYTFKDIGFLSLSLVHPSMTVSSESQLENNQRLEFLGDSVLNLTLSTLLFEQFPQEREGTLAMYKSILAQGSVLVELAKKLKIEDFLKIETSTEELPASALEDALEAIIGAIYLDSDFPTTRSVIKNWYGDIASQIDRLLKAYNPKGRLQEVIQKEMRENPIRYKTILSKGPSHKKYFEVEVYIDNQHFGTGSGTSKKEAEEAAAQIALKKISDKQS